MEQKRTRRQASTKARPDTTDRNGSADDGQRTRGGWVPMGTAADRRATHEERGTPRGERTRALILEAARRLFETRGYIDVNIEDIVEAAGVARGSFYTYFESKLQVFRVLSADVAGQVDEVVASGASEDRRDAVAELDRSNRLYIEVYRRNAAILGLLEHVATIDPEVQQMHRGLRQAHLERMAATIRRWQQQGIADPEVDPATTAAALVSMTVNFCHWWFVGGDDYDPEQAALTLNRIWVRSLGLRARPRSKPASSQS